MLILGYEVCNRADGPNTLRERILSNVLTKRHTIVWAGRNCSSKKRGVRSWRGKIMPCNWKLSSPQEGKLLSRRRSQSLRLCIRSASSRSYPVLLLIPSESLRHWVIGIDFQTICSQAAETRLPTLSPDQHDVNGNTSLEDFLHLSFLYLYTQAPSCQKSYLQAEVQRLKGVKADQRAIREVHRKQEQIWDKAKEASRQLVSDLALRSSQCKSLQKLLRALGDKVSESCRLTCVQNIWIKSLKPFASHREVLGRQKLQGIARTSLQSLQEIGQAHAGRLGTQNHQVILKAENVNCLPFAL